MKNINENKKIELLAPAGNIHKMKTAIAFGADAVYLGVPDFSLRVRINDFDMDSIKEAVRYCHQAGVKVYVTLNIFAHNRHFEALPLYVKELKKMGVDALIISDPGVMAVVKNDWPEAEIHLSTQANCTNWQAAKFWHSQGVSRIILGREVTLDEIAEINKRVPQVELEYFVHGAMCMAYSGRCFLSKLMANRSGNLGDCVQPCRWKYRDAAKIQIANDKSQISSKFIMADGRNEILEIVEEQHGSYILNSQDLCLLPYIRALLKTGITSLKIEGRAKSAYYQAMVAGVYRQALDLLNNDKLNPDKLDELYKELETKLVHRGYTTGFLLGDKAEQNIEASHEQSDWEFCGQVISDANLRIPARPAGGNANLPIANNANIVLVHNSLKVGDEVEVLMPYYSVEKIKIDKLFNIAGEEIDEAHGGQDMEAVLEGKSEWPRYSVLRRKIT